MNQQNNTTRILTLLVSVMLLVGSSFIAFQQYTDTRISVARIQSENRILENRLRVLEEVSTYIGAYVPQVAAAVPESNAGYFGLSTVKLEANEESLLVDNVAVRAVSQADQPLSQSEIAFEVEGPSDSVFAFTQQLFRNFPVMGLVTLNNRTINETSALSRSQIVLKAVSKAFPAQLPALTETIAALSSGERSILDELITFQSTNTPTSSDSTSDPGDEVQFGRTNPFSAAETLNISTPTDGGIVIDTEE